MRTTLPTDLRIDYDVRQNGVEERMLKREKECSVRRRGSSIHSCARSETKRACVLFRKVAVTLEQLEGIRKFCVTVFSSTSIIVFSAILPYRQFQTIIGKNDKVFT